MIVWTRPANGTRVDSRAHFHPPALWWRWLDYRHVVKRPSRKSGLRTSLWMMRGVVSKCISSPVMISLWQLFFLLFLSLSAGDDTYRHSGRQRIKAAFPNIHLTDPHAVKEPIFHLCSYSKWHARRGASHCYNTVLPTNMCHAHLNMEAEAFFSAEAALVVLLTEQCDSAVVQMGQTQIVLSHFKSPWKLMARRLQSRTGITFWCFSGRTLSGNEL